MKLQFSKIIIASDHAAYEMKVDVLKHLKNTYSQLEIVDGGCYSPDRVDYPDIAKNACKGIQKGVYDGGILICGSGIGISISCNRHPGIRAALCHNEYTAEMSRQHNNANVLNFGARVVDLKTATNMVDKWLHEEFCGGRHAVRVDKIEL